LDFGHWTLDIGHWTLETTHAKAGTACAAPAFGLARRFGKAG
jgi:hypothetical protein